MSGKVNLPLAGSANYENHCRKGICGNHYKDEEGKTFCHAMEGDAYGQLKQLVGDGEPCPEGLFGKQPPEPQAKMEVAQEQPVFLKLIESAKEVVFKFDDGELTWKKT